MPPKSFKNETNPSAAEMLTFFGDFWNQRSPVFLVNSFPLFWNVALAPLDQRDLFGHRAFVADAGDYLDPLVGLQPGQAAAGKGSGGDEDVLAAVIR